MRLNALWMIAAAGLAMAGCNNAESPGEVRHDVADARAEGQRDIADAQADAREDLADARKDVYDARVDGDAGDVLEEAQQASEAAAKGDFKVAVAQAEANHRVAIEKCEALGGEAQKDCKDRADSELEMAKKQAEMRRDGAG